MTPIEQPERQEEIVEVEEKEDQEDILKIDETRFIERMTSMENLTESQILDMSNKLEDAINDVNNQMDWLLDISLFDKGEINIDSTSKDEFKAVSAIAEKFNQKINEISGKDSSENFEQSLSKITSNEKLVKILKEWEESDKEVMIGDWAVQHAANAIKDRQNKIEEIYQKASN